MKWQPIETAILTPLRTVLVSDGQHVTAAEWYPDHEQWWEINNHYTDSWGSPLYPTHWMPLPDPPQDKP